ncbi:hypothetical protein [Streptomyces sp. NPDC012466]|jgi:hypothetical protein|uniref:hypothetical protein n=1 Tax=Streptomyces sp. NPDC012466 TaxID=3364835 RepID=UPI0036E2F3E5
MTRQGAPHPAGLTAAPVPRHLDLYLRIAPELYLKRLCVGGLEPQQRDRPARRASRLGGVRRTGDGLRSR